MYVLVTQTLTPCLLVLVLQLPDAGVRSLDLDKFDDTHTAAVQAQRAVLKKRRKALGKRHVQVRSQVAARQDRKVSR